MGPEMLNKRMARCRKIQENKMKRARKNEDTQPKPARAGPSLLSRDLQEVASDTMRTPPKNSGSDSSEVSDVSDVSSVHSSDLSDDGKTTPKPAPAGTSLLSQALQGEAS